MTDKSFELVVDNVAPTLAFGAGQASTVNEGDLFLLDPVTFEDPGFDVPGNPSIEDFTSTIIWGDGHSDPGTLTETPGGPGTPTTGEVSGSHVYADNGTYTVTVEICDDDNGCVSGSFDITVNNVAPTVHAGPDGTVDEGALFTRTGPVAWWEAESNAQDSANGHHGALQNDTTFAPGNIGQAFSFDGVDDTQA